MPSSFPAWIPASETRASSKTSSPLPLCLPIVRLSVAPPLGHDRQSDGGELKWL